MREELENYLAMLEGDLEVEVDLHGGRTTRARDLRNLITYMKQELAGLKTDDVTNDTRDGVDNRCTI
jgi:hypothetical protein